MSESASPPPAGGKLPELQQALLDPATLAALFRDLAQCTRVLAVVPKSSARGPAPEHSIDLAAAQTGLAAGEFRGVQVRYVYEGKEWCDTLLAAPAGVRLVRICTDDARASGATG